MSISSPKIKLIKSTFYNEDETKQRLSDFIKSSAQLSMGEQCRQFEAAFSKLQGCKYTVLYNSGSSANLALIQALVNMGRLKKGHKVAFSAVTWATNVMPLIQLGLEAVPIDISHRTLNVHSAAFRQACDLEKDIKAFFISNILGLCGDIDSIASICKERGIILLEDNCESFGTVYKGKKLGNFGLASTCSSFVGHHLSTIEGGMVCTDDNELAQMLKIVRAHGWDRSLSATEQLEMRRHHAIDSFYDLYTFYDLGYNLRPTEITGFLGLRQVEIADVIVQKRFENFQRFHAAAQLNASLLPVTAGNIDVVSNFAYPVICNDCPNFRKSRERFLDNNVEIRPIVAGNITSQPFFKKYSDRTWRLPEADLVHNQGFYCPNNPELGESELERLCRLIAGHE